jgi:hypothetical protein
MRKDGSSMCYVFLEDCLLLWRVLDLAVLYALSGRAADIALCIQRLAPSACFSCAVYSTYVMRPVAWLRIGGELGVA